MSFAKPWVLWGLLVLLIPILLHLVQLRKFKKVYLSDISLLQEVNKDGLAKRNLMELLILLLRLTFISSLVFAFAGVSCSGKVETEFKKVFIYIDNSPSVFGADVLEGKESRLEQLKRSAAAEINSKASGTRFSISSNDNFYQSDQFFAKELALQKLANLEPSTAKVNWEILLSAVRNVSSKDVSYSLYSDFSQFGKLPEDVMSSNKYISFFLLPERESELLIDSAWIVSSSELETDIDSLKFIITNHGPVTKAEQSLLFSHQFGDVEHNFSITEGGNYTGGIALTDEIQQNAKSAVLYLKPSKNTPGKQLYLNGLSKEVKKVLVISDSEVLIQGFEKLLEGLSWSELTVKNTQEVVPSDLHQADVVVLGQLNTISSGLLSQLENISTKGANLLVIPGEKLREQDYVNLCSVFQFGIVKGLDSLNVEFDDLRSNELFVEVFDEFGQDESQKLNLPEQRYYLSLEVEKNKVFLKSKEGRALGSKSGNAIMLMGPVFSDYSTLDEHPYLIPIMYKSVLKGQGDRALFVELAKNDKIKVDAKVFESQLTLMDPKGKRLLVPIKDGELLVDSRFKEPGTYKLGSDSAWSDLGVNYNRDELHIDSTRVELNRLIASKSNFFEKSLEDSDGSMIEVLGAPSLSPSVRLLLLLSLLALIGEMLIGGIKYRSSK